MNYFGEDELTQELGIGYLGEIRRGLDGGLYQWVQGVDGLGNPVGFWKKLRKGLRRVARKALPLVQRFAPLVPGGAAVAAGLRVASPYLRKAGVAGAGGLGALYQAPDGTLYQVQGLAQDEELSALAEDEELQSFAENEDMGYLSEDEMEGLAEDEELEGYGEDEDLGDLYGYVTDEGVSGVEAYVPDMPAQTRMFERPAQTPDIWRSLW
jgi:hypothetical protein